MAKKYNLQFQHPECLSTSLHHWETIKLAYSTPSTYTVNLHHQPTPSAYTVSLHHQPTPSGWIVCASTPIYFVSHITALWRYVFISISVLLADLVSEICAVGIIAEVFKTFRISFAVRFMCSFPTQILTYLFFCLPLPNKRTNLFSERIVDSKLNKSLFLW